MSLPTHSVDSLSEAPTHNNNMGSFIDQEGDLGLRMELPMNDCHHGSSSSCSSIIFSLLSISNGSVINWFQNSSSSSHHSNRDLHGGLVPSATGNGSGNGSSLDDGLIKCGLCQDALLGPKPYHVSTLFVKTVCKMPNNQQLKDVDDRLICSTCHND
jgi:hypothetical protein